MAAGRKTGGRRKGTPNRATEARQAQIAASGLTPLDFMLSVLRDEQQSFEARMDAAKAAAPYCHPKRAPVDADGNESGLTVIVNKG